MTVYDYFVCPVCKCELSSNGSSLRCVKGHSFDISSSGYVNLLNPGKMNNRRAGDSKEMIRARSDFFSSGAYAKIAELMCETVSSLSPSVIVDAGCGEGYYTDALAKSNTSSLVFGFDMSKFGCEHGGKVAKRNLNTNLCYAVGNIFDIPLKDNFADVIVNMFAPVAACEFNRLLKNGGYLLVASAGIDHLDGLKELIYNSAYKNEEKILNYEGFELQEVKNLRYVAEICGNDTINNLFKMTPYYHRTSLSDKEKLLSVSSLKTTVEVNLAIYKKVAN